MISLSEVKKAFGKVYAVDGISIEVNPGEIFGLVGPDGAGKTTAIRLITGLLKPNSGTIKVLGEENIEYIKKDIGYVPQRFSLYGDLTVIENIRVIGSLYGAPSAQVDHLATEILSFTNLLPFKDRLADNLSGGMKQKLALACGLMHKPKLFFLDEPTTGVDPISRREFWHLLYRLNKEGVTIFVSTPYMDEAELCHKIAFMHNGRIVACNSPQALKEAYPFKLLELHAGGKNVKELFVDADIADINAFGEKYHLVVTDPTHAAEQVKNILALHNIPIYSLHVVPPTLEDVFVALATEVMI